MIGRVFARAEREIEANPTLRPQQRAGLRTRLAESRGSTAMLPDDSLSALVRLQEAQIATERRLWEIAGRRGMSLREAREEFVRLRTEAPQGRQRRANADELRDLGAMPTDPATRYAIATMESRPPVHPPVRLVQQWIPVSGHPQISHLGLSDLSNRVEVRAHDGTITAVCGTATALLASAQESATANGRLAADSADDLILSGTAIPPDRVEAAGFAVRCDFCGRFTGELGHDCPVRNVRALTYTIEQHTDGGTTLVIPPVQAVQAAVDQSGPVHLNGISYVCADAVVTGFVVARPGADVITDIDRRSRQRVDIDDAAPDLRCDSCQSSSCPHTADAIRLIRHQLSSAGRLPGDRAARAARQERLHTEFRITERRPHVEEPAEPAATSFLSNPETFRTVILTADPVRQADELGADAAVRPGHEDDRSVE